MAASRLGRQIQEIAGALHGAGIRFALIGGLALASHRVVRATQDVDLLVDSADAEALDGRLLALGYRCRHRSEDAANYERSDERLDFIFARRPVARRLLASAPSSHSTLGDLNVVSAEGLIGFKLQAWVNDPSRSRDLEDIRALLKANPGLDMAEVREYFRLFEREALLDELLSEIR